MQYPDHRYLLNLPYYCGIFYTAEVGLWENLSVKLETNPLWVIGW